MSKHVSLNYCLVFVCFSDNEILIFRERIRLDCKINEI